MLRYMLDENEFLSPYRHSLALEVTTGQPYTSSSCDEPDSACDYVPGESDSGLFGGNSNWRGPIWFPVNYLLIEALGRYHHFYGDGFAGRVPHRLRPLDDARRSGRESLPRGWCGSSGRMAAAAGRTRECGGAGADEPLLFYEYFDAETGRGLGASHQTGWTALVASCLKCWRESRDHLLSFPTFLGYNRVLISGTRICRKPPFFRRKAPLRPMESSPAVGGMNRMTAPRSSAIFAREAVRWPRASGDSASFARISRGRWSRRPMAAVRVSASIRSKRSR